MEREGNLTNLRSTAYYFFISVYLSFAMYLVGFIGLNIPITAIYFKFFTPIHLIFNMFLLFFFQKEKNKSFYLFCVIIFLSGFVIEFLGVETGEIFGNYHYGSTLGIKFLNVPIIIGVNWLILTYCAGTIIQNYFPFLSTHDNYFSIIIKSIAAALLMVGLDFLIEPVADRHDFWHWKSNFIPIKNYIAWFIISFLMELFFYSLKFNKNNPLTFSIYWLQVLFFGAHQFFLQK